MTYVRLLLQLLLLETSLFIFLVMLKVVSVAMFNKLMCNETTGVAEVSHMKSKITCSPKLWYQISSGVPVRLFCLDLLSSFRDLFPQMC